MSFSAQGAFGGAMGGAQMGASFGPWGALAGGILGGIGGGFLGGGDSSAKVAKDLLGRQMDRQEIWMKNQMRWRVEDAKAAGIHPLAAIGSNVTAPSVPGVSVGDSGSDIGSILASSGQSIGRELSAYMSGQEKDKASMRALELEGQALDNDYKREQLKRLRGVGSPPDFPDLAVGESYVPVGEPKNMRDAWRYGLSPVTYENLPPPAVQASGLIDVKPSEALTTPIGMSGREAASNPENKWIRNEDGTITWVPSEALNIDDASSPGWLSWQIRNGLLPALPYANRPIPENKFLPKGAKGWIYNPWTGSYRPTFEHQPWNPYFTPDGNWERR